MKTGFYCLFRKAILAGLVPALILPFFGSMPALAYGNDSLIEGAKLCTRYLPRHERKYGIPLHLLAAIASTESGRWHNGLNLALPWPWTLNAEGKGYYFDTKQEAINKVQELQKRGVKSIDVGCMQVNLAHHPQAFANLNQAFDPRYNVEYAAQFLKNLYAEGGSWKKAAASYHSRTSSKGNQYVGLVYKSWQRIIKQVRTARSLAGTQYARTRANAFGDTSVNAREFASAGAALALSATPKALPAHRSPHMRIIQVSKPATQPSKENGVKVIRPETAIPAAQEIKSTPQASLQTPSAASTEVPTAVASLTASPEAANENFVRELTPRIVTLAAPAKKSGPNFIFN